MEKRSLRIVHITDIHLFADPSRSLLGVNTQDSFEALLELLRNDNTSPDIILLSGDLSQDGSETAYMRLADMLSTFKIPVYCIPGNHDDIQVMKKIYPRATMIMDKQIILDGWQLILLDSHIQGAVRGYLEKEELDFMQNCLKTNSSHRSIVVFHHQPIPVGCAWLDKIGVTNAEEFWEYLKPFPQVKYVIFGHVHQQHEGEKNNIKYFSTPSTCIQFKTNSDEFALEELAPAYRLIDLYANGDLKTSVRRVAHYIGKFEKDAKGY